MSHNNNNESTGWSKIWNAIKFTVNKIIEIAANTVGLGYNFVTGIWNLQAKNHNQAESSSINSGEDDDFEILPPNFYGNTPNPESQLPKIAEQIGQTTLSVSKKIGTAALGSINNAYEKWKEHSNTQQQEEAIPTFNFSSPYDAESNVSKVRKAILSGGKKIVEAALKHVIIPFDEWRTGQTYGIDEESVQTSIALSPSPLIRASESSYSNNLENIGRKWGLLDVPSNDGVEIEMVELSGKNDGLSAESINSKPQYTPKKPGSIFKLFKQVAAKNKQEEALELSAKAGGSSSDSPIDAELRKLEASLDGWSPSDELGNLVQGAKSTAINPLSLGGGAGGFDRNFEGGGAVFATGELEELESLGHSSDLEWEIV